LARMGMVLRRSTTELTCPRGRSKLSLSIANLIGLSLIFDDQVQLPYFDTQNIAVQMKIITPYRLITPALITGQAERAFTGLAGVLMIRKN